MTQLESIIGFHNCAVSTYKSAVPLAIIKTLATRA